MKKILKVLILVFSALALYGAFTVYANKKAYDIRTKVTQELSESFQSGILPSLPAAGNVQWDYICSGSYEARGIDVASAVWIGERALVKHVIDDNKLDFSGFDIADEIYTEFSGSRHGLVFISKKEKILIGTLFPADIRLYGLSCVAAVDAVLLDIPKAQYPDISGTYSRYVILSGTKLK